MWKGNAGGESSPVWAASNVVMAPIGFQTRTLRAYDGATGAVVWDFSLTNTSSWLPSIASFGALDEAAGLAFVGDLESTLTAVDIRSGRARWRYNAGPDAEIWSTLGGASVGRLVCFGAGGTGDVSADCKAALHCLDKETGALVWKARAGKQIQSRPVAGLSKAGQIYVGDYDNCLYAFALATGGFRWKACTAGRLESSGVVRVDPASGEDLIIIGSGDGRLYCFTEAGGVRWATPLAPPVGLAFGGIGSSPLLDRGVVYVGAVGVWAVDAATGAPLWQFNLTTPAANDLDTFVGASPRLGTGAFSDVLYVAGEDGVMYALNVSGTQPPAPGLVGVSGGAGGPGLLLPL